MPNEVPNNVIVLLGIGHTNAEVLRRWSKQPLPGARLVCVSDFPMATYSGMLPGVLAGDYVHERMEIDLQRLATASGAQFIQGRVNGLDVDARRLLFEHQEALSFDVLSIGIGSVPSFDGVDAVDDSVVPIKPMQTFVDRLQAKLQQIKAQNSDQPIRIVVVGGGVAGVEIAFCIPHALGEHAPDRQWDLSIVHAAEQLAEGTLPATQRKIHRELEKRGVKLHAGRRVRNIADGQLQTDSGLSLPADIVLWATGAAAPPLLRQLNLPADKRGFLLTDQTLRTTAGAPIFAVGDTGTMESESVPKAGVFAVRQAPILWENIERTLAGKELVRYHPQRRFLKLLNTGDRRAIGEYPLGKRFGLSSHSRWMWKLKELIDSRFVSKYQG